MCGETGMDFRVLCVGDKCGIVEYFVWRDKWVFVGYGVWGDTFGIVGYFVWGEI